LFTTAVFIGLKYRFGFTAQFAVYSIFSIFLITAGIVDIRIRILPNVINAVGIAVAFIISLTYSIITSNLNPIGEFFIGGAICGIPFFLIKLVSKHGMGMGDVKFAVLIGSFLGVINGLSALWLSIVFGGVFGAIMIAAKKATRKTRIPFGPFMVLGALAMVIFGNYIRLVIFGAWSRA